MMTENTKGKSTHSDDTSKLSTFQQQLMGAAGVLSEEFAEYLNDSNAFVETGHAHYKNALEQQKLIYEEAKAKFRALVERAVENYEFVEICPDFYQVKIPRGKFND
jgi:CO dehydrogenase/acetyl-CoA synthase beta subunit